MDEILFTDDKYRRQYRQTLQLGLIKIVQDLFPLEKLKIPYSILDGIYCELSESLVSSREVKLIEETLKRWVSEDHPIEFIRIINRYYEYQVGDTLIQSIHPAFDHSSIIKNFELIHFPPGFILHFSEKPTKHPSFLLPEKLSATYAESQRWLENINLDGVNDVNNYISYGRSLELISIAEALHEKKISKIADMIYEQKKAIKVVLISGPSSSGKTTFTQRLSTQLRVNGLKPVSLSLDDYFLNREDTPRDPSGQYDFDALEALDLELLNKQLEKLINGKIVEIPIFNFLTGKRSPKGRFLQLGKNEILLVEGIHALNPNLLSFEKKDHFFKIYLSALFLLNIDGLNRVPTTEARLIRRIVRDDKFRSFSPERTLKQWASVRRGENNSVFKYQEEADIMFNSSILYELNALRPTAEVLLRNVPEDDEYYDTAIRLLNLLSFFKPMELSQIPSNSILCEFIGGSIYST